MEVGCHQAEFAAGSSRIPTRADAGTVPVSQQRGAKQALGAAGRPDMGRKDRSVLTAHLGTTEAPLHSTS